MFSLMLKIWKQLLILRKKKNNSSEILQECGHYSLPAENFLFD